MLEHDVHTYSPESVKRISNFSNTVTASQMLEAILEESRATVLTVYLGEGDNKRTVLLDKGYIQDLNKIGFQIYLRLMNEGLQAEASDVLEINGVHQQVDFDHLLEIDQEYLL